jgi:hypothetical protein
MDLDKKDERDWSDVDLDEQEYLIMLLENASWLHMDDSFPKEDDEGLTITS